MDAIDKTLGEQPQAAPRKEKRREEKPKNNPKEDLGYRINGLEQAKSYPGMTNQDIAALDRVIRKLKDKLAEKSERKEQ